MKLMHTIQIIEECGIGKTLKMTFMNAENRISRKIGEKSIAKISLILVSLSVILIFLIKFIIPILASDPLVQYNQTQTANITGNASTITQSTIDSYLNINRDGLTWDITEALQTSVVKGILAYGEGTVTAPKYRIWNGTSWSSELSANDVGGVINWTVIKASPTRDEWMLGTKDNLDDINIQINASGCWGDGTACGTVLEVTASTSANVFKSFDIAYEGLKGRAIVVYSDNTATPKYRIWDGTSWSNENSVPITKTTGSVRTIELAERPKSNEIALVYDDANDDLGVMVWNGTAWIWEHTAALETGLPTTNFRDFDVAYENSGDLLIVWGFGTTADIRYAVKPAGSGTYTITTDTAWAEIGNMVRVGAEPGGDRICVATRDISGDDMDSAVWLGTSFSAHTTDTSCLSEVVARTMLGCGWVGTSGRAILGYADASNTVVDWRSWTTAGWVAENDFTPSPAIQNETDYVVKAFPAENKTFVIFSDANADLWAKIVNTTTGTAGWSNTEGGAALELTLSSHNTQAFDFDFQFLNYYGVSVEHNTTISYSGTLNSINVSVNFTSTLDDIYNMSIFNFASSAWDASPCQNLSVTVSTYNTIWCNVTTSPMNYNSSTVVVRIRLNSTADSDQGTLKEEYVQYNISYQIGYLEVQLITPNSTETTYVTQNNIFLINASVICKDGPCGNVYGTAKYNLTSTYPDIPINTTFGDKPFFVNETPALATKACPTNPLEENEFCNLTWIINATGDVDSVWKIGVLFNSSFVEVQQNHTENATVYIAPCTEEISLAWTSIDFGLLIPSTNYNPAPYNNQNFYNITNKGTCPLNLWIKGIDLQNSTFGSTITVGNLSWSNYSSSYIDFHRNMTYTYVLINSNLLENQNLTTYYWLSVPAVYAGYYIGSVYICGNYSSTC